MHSRRRGSSDSDKPVADEPPEWSDVAQEAIEERVVDLAAQGHSPSEIGLKLRDEGVQGTSIPDVKLAVRLHEHVEQNGQDYQNKRALQNTESKIRRLVDYYRGDEIDAEFTYSYDDAVELLE